MITREKGRLDVQFNTYKGGGGNYFFTGKVVEELKKKLNQTGITE